MQYVNPKKTRLKRNQIQKSYEIPNPNRLAQDNLEIRKLCAEGEKKTKRLARELNKQDKAVWENWWESNGTWKEDADRRLKDDYKQEGSKGMIGKHKKPQTKRIVRWLNHYRYGREITGMIQSLMIGTIFLEQFNVPRKWYIIIIPATAFGFVLIGFLLKRWKIFENDLEYRSTQNPMLNEMMQILKRIDK